MVVSKTDGEAPPRIFEMLGGFMVGLVVMFCIVSLNCITIYGIFLYSILSQASHCKVLSFLLLCWSLICFPPGWPQLQWFVTEGLNKPPKDWMPPPRPSDNASAYIEVLLLHCSSLVPFCLHPLLCSFSIFPVLLSSF